MRPRLASGGFPVGLSRRKRSAKLRPTKGSSNSRPPVLQLCQCYDCAACPGAHPVTGLPSTGRYLAPYELKVHRRRDRQRGTAALMLGTDLQAPQLDLPTPLTLSTLTFPPPHPRPHAPKPPTMSIPLFTQPPSSSSSLRTPKTKSQSSAQFEELEALIHLVKPAEEVIGKDKLVFKTPPTAFSPAVAELSIESIDHLCALDSTVKKNSAIFGYHQLLIRILRCANDNAATENTRFRLRCQLARRSADQELTTLRRLKLDQWESQRLAAIENYTVIDTG
jgi:hypothetical protein